VQRLAAGDDLVPEHPGREDVQLQLDRREVVLGRNRAKGRPGGDGVAEGGPDATVDEAAGMQVALVDDDPADRVGVLDLQRLYAEVAGKASRQEGADALGRDRRARLVRVRHLAGPY